jgi:hypothetical protein
LNGHLGKKTDIGGAAIVAQCDGAGEGDGKVAVGGGGGMAGGASVGIDAGSVGRAGGSEGGKAGSAHGGIGGGAMTGGDAGSVNGLGESDDDEGAGSSLDGGVAVRNGRERRISPTGSESCNSSNSFRRFLVLLAGGGATSVRKGGDGVQLGRDTGPPAGAATTRSVDWALPTAVAA